MNRRRKRRLPFAAYAALIFNGALCAAPFMAAHLVSSAYGDRPTAFETTPEALAATRLAMDERFQLISAGEEAEPREVWSDLVRNSLEQEEMPLVRGLLLGAPAMLGAPDGEALRARIEKVAKGVDDEAVLLAAVSYLPGEVQETYLNFNQGGPRFTAAATADVVAKATPSVALPDAPEPVDVTTPTPAERRVAINRVGDIRGLTDTAVDWANDDTIDLHAFLLSGIALIMADSEAREGASVAMPALRARTQSPVPFKAYLTRRIEDVVNVDEMKRLLSAELHFETGYTPDATAVVEKAFRSTVDREKLDVLLNEFKILREIALDTSFEAAIAIVGRVQGGVDLRAARLVAAAGGERAVALEHFDGENLLETARTVIPWTNALRLQAAGLAACLALLGFVALTTFWKSFRRNRPVKKSAVYLMEETPA